MGADMYCFVEEKVYPDHDHFHNGKWVSIDKWTKNMWAALFPESDKAPTWEVKREDMIFTDQNYDLSAILANQWNSVNMPYICNPRGLPEDVSSEIRLQLEYNDLHITTWFTAKELFEFNWNQVFDCELTIDGEKMIETVNYKECGGELIDVIKRLIGSKNPSETRLIIAFDIA